MTFKNGSIIHSRYERPGSEIFLVVVGICRNGKTERGLTVEHFPLKKKEESARSMYVEVESLDRYVEVDAAYAKSVLLERLETNRKRLADFEAKVNDFDGILKSYV